MHGSPLLRLALLAGPFCAALVLLWRPGPRRGSRALELALLTALVMVATLAVTVLGDGLADVAKQGHLVTNAALAWWMVAAIGLLAARMRGGSPGSA